MKVLHQHITAYIEQFAPTQLKESYDNVGLLVGNSQDECTGVMIGFDCTPTLVEEAIAHRCNLIVTHHPLIFQGLKRLGTQGLPSEALRLLIKNDIAHYAVHTNIDNWLGGVSASFVQCFDLQEARPLVPKEDTLKKLVFFAPNDQVETINTALYQVGGGHIGNYSCCSYQTEGKGSFLPNQHAKPFVGEAGKLHYEKETRVEMIFPVWREHRIVRTLLAHHPYEEVAYDIIALDNTSHEWGSGVIGTLPKPLSESDFLSQLKSYYGTPCIKHTFKQGRTVRRVAFCGGSGASFIAPALAQGADAYVTGDLKYHDFLDASYTKMLLADIGHFESEISIVELLYQKISSEFLSFVVLKGGGLHSPVVYF